MISWEAVIDSLRAALEATFDEFPPDRTAAGLGIERAFCKLAFEDATLAAVTRMRVDYAPTPSGHGGAAAQPIATGWRREFEILAACLRVCFQTLSPEQVDEAIAVGRSFDRLVTQTRAEVSDRGGMDLERIRLAWRKLSWLSTLVWHEIHVWVKRPTFEAVAFLSGTTHPKHLGLLKRICRDLQRNPDAQDAIVMLALNARFELRCRIWAEKARNVKREGHRARTCDRLTAWAETSHQAAGSPGNCTLEVCGTLTRALPSLLNPTLVQEFVDGLMTDMRARASGVPLLIALCLGEKGADLLHHYISHTEDETSRLECVEGLRRLGGHDGTLILCALLHDGRLWAPALTAIEWLAFTPLSELLEADESPDIRDQDTIRRVSDHLSELSEQNRIAAERADWLQTAVNRYTSRATRNGDNPGSGAPVQGLVPTDRYDQSFMHWALWRIAEETGKQRDEAWGRLTFWAEDRHRRTTIDGDECEVGGTLTRGLPCLLDRSNAERLTALLKTDPRQRSDEVPLAVALCLGESAVDLLRYLIEHSPRRTFQIECVEALRRAGGDAAARALCELMEEPGLRGPALVAIESLATVPVICLGGDESPSDAAMGTVAFVSHYIDDLLQRRQIGDQRASELQEALERYLDP